MRELFNNLVSSMKGYWVDPAPFTYMDPETGEDVYDEADLYYYYESSLEDFLEATKEIKVPSGTITDARIEEIDTDVDIWVDGRIALKVDRFSRRVIIKDFECIEDKHLYALINLVRKEVLVPSR